MNRASSRRTAPGHGAAPQGPSAARAQVLDGGRRAAIAQRRADSQACQQRVRRVIAQMQRAGQPLSNAEITRRAQVNSQYLQRHRELKAYADRIRAELAGAQQRVDVAVRAETEAALMAENAMLTEQNAQLHRDLAAALDGATILTDRVSYDWWVVSEADLRDELAAAGLEEATPVGPQAAQLYVTTPR